MSADSPNAEANGGGRLPDDVIAEVLASPRRRLLLAAVLPADDPVPVVDIARRIVAEERDRAPNRVSDEAVEEVKADVYATHLPKLTALRVVDFDSQIAGVEPAENAPEVRDRLGEK
ncbi:hypothetical protein G9464_18395 [Halostella sp. JP-L12]|uniref:DUF7344 domain-containing protein n=1 Tax=Halostella TaxID=1843185 RepID=UPI000EF83F71|nr:MULTISPECIES: hypothetical protein [Halostella]NHN49544.1 hypothetical protein [Halostella sp. JP-L12]